MEMLPMNLCGFEVGLDKPFFLIAGPCVIESMQLQLDTAGTLKEITSELGIPFIFKSSFDKANRTSVSGFRGPGMEEGLKVLAEVKRQLDLPVLTDVRLALSKLDLKMNGMPSSLVISLSLPAVSSCSCIDSMTHGPAMRKKGLSRPTSNPARFMRSPP